MQNPPFPRAVIFDWDNTLVDSWSVIAEAMNHTQRHFGMPEWPLDEVKAKCTRAARDSFPEWFGAEWKKAYEIYYEGFNAVRKKRPLEALRGAPELLSWLSEAKVPMFIVSNKRGDYLREEAVTLGWTKYLTAIVGSFDAPRDKPAREHVDHALAKSGVTADASVWFVGDSETDMQCARNADCTPVLIGHTDFARKLNIELVFPDCAALQKLLYNLRNNKGHITT